jgi:oligopeptide transport system substrate-binding protein
MNQADAELDPKKRMDLYQQAQDLLVGGGYVAFMWNDVNAYLVKPWVQGVTATAMDADWPGAIVPTSITIADH